MVIQHLSASMSIRTAMPGEGLYVFLAEAYLLTGDTNKAIKTLSNAIKAFPEKKMAYEHFYLGYLLGVKGEHKKALEESLLALKIDPNLANQEGFKERLSILKEKNSPGETSP
jgi:tetratricopeptide (TPR) repeat protein